MSCIVHTLLKDELSYFGLLKNTELLEKKEEDKLIFF
jgi:hypothetical protein